MNWARLVIIIFLHAANPTPLIRAHLVFGAGSETRIHVILDLSPLQSVLELIQI